MDGRRTRLSGPVIGCPDAWELAGSTRRCWGGRSSTAPRPFLAGGPCGVAHRRTQARVPARGALLPPVWPTVAGEQQMGMHLDIGVDGLAHDGEWSCAARSSSKLPSGPNLSAHGSPNISPSRAGARHARSGRPSVLPLPGKLSRGTVSPAGATPHELGRAHGGPQPGLRLFELEQAFSEQPAGSHRVALPVGDIAEHGQCVGHQTAAAQLALVAQALFKMAFRRQRSRRLGRRAGQEPERLGHAPQVAEIGV